MSGLRMVGFAVRSRPGRDAACLGPPGRFARSAPSGVRRVGTGRDRRRCRPRRDRRGRRRWCASPGRHRGLQVERAKAGRGGSVVEAVEDADRVQTVRGAEIDGPPGVLLFVGVKAVSAGRAAGDGAGGVFARGGGARGVRSSSGRQACPRRRWARRRAARADAGPGRGGWPRTGRGGRPGPVEMSEQGGGLVAIQQTGPVALVGEVGRGAACAPSLEVLLGLDEVMEDAGTGEDRVAVLRLQDVGPGVLRKIAPVFIHGRAEDVELRRRQQLRRPVVVAGCDACRLRAVRFGSRRSGSWSWCGHRGWGSAW